MKFWFSVVPTLPFTSLDNGCAMVSPLDHPELDEGTSNKINMSPRDEQGASVPKTSIGVTDMSLRDEQGVRVSKTSIRVKVMSPRDKLRARHVYRDKKIMYKSEWFVRAWIWMERIYKLLFMERNLCKHCHGFCAWGVI
uniref:Uncharacterized protein n=1 Tax=Lepeophtheirus salmonis TaxID=72036 RepID=A0A0K2V218_LEPSM